MPDKLWLNVPTPNRSRWIRDAIRQRLAKDNAGLSDDYITALNESNTQLNKIGINLNQVAVLLHSGKVNATALPIRELIMVVRATTKDIREIKKLYLSND